MREKIREIVLGEVDVLNTTLRNKIDISRGEDAELYGKGGVLDSLSLVTLVVAVEGALEKEFGMTFVLADDKAFSQRVSPFKSVRTLTDYVVQLVENEKSA